MEIVLNCDLVVAGEDAKFALPEVKRGVVAIQGGIPRLTQVAGHQVSQRMLNTIFVFSLRSRWIIKSYCCAICVTPQYISLSLSHTNTPAVDIDVDILSPLSTLTNSQSELPTAILTEILPPSSSPRNCCLLEKQ